MRALPGGALISKGTSIAIVTAAAVVAVDQATKAWIMMRLLENQFLEVVPGLFNIVHFRNTGAAFGILTDGGTLKTVFLLAVTVVALVVIWSMLTKSGSMFYSTALSLIAGGAVGNMIDRVRFASVVDFLDVYYGSYHWPAFNVADASITTGVILALVSHFFMTQEKNPD
jgi:signal peptidase II